MGEGSGRAAAQSPPLGVVLTEDPRMQTHPRVPFSVQVPTSPRMLTWKRRP